MRSRKTILRRDRRNAHTRAFPARTRGVVFSLATVWRHARPSSDPRPPDSRAPPSALSSPTAAFGAEHGVSRGASRASRIPRSSLPHARRLRRVPAIPSRRRAVDRLNARERVFRSFLTVRSPTSPVLARARGCHHPRGRVHQAGHGVRRRPTGYCRVEQGTSIKRTRADRASRARRNTAPSSETSGVQSKKPTIRAAVFVDFFARDGSLVSARS